MTDFSHRFAFDKQAKKIIVHTGKVEIGQHVHKAFANIVAQTLGIDSSSVKMSSISTQSSPDDGMTVGSLSMQVTGASLRVDASALKAAFMSEAAQKLNTEVANITLDGLSLRYSANDSSCSIFDLPTAATATITSFDDAGKWASTSTIAASVLGERLYIQDLVLPGMIHARAIRGRGYSAKDIAEADGVSVLNDGGFSAIVAKSEAALERAWAQLDTTPVPRATNCNGPVTHWIQKQRVQTNETGDTSAINGTLFQSATRAFLLHASIAPSCAVACFNQGVLEIWTHSQGIFPLRDTIAGYLDMQPDKVIVQHVPSAGSYGHNAADDAVMDAVLVSLHNEGVPVRVVWTRQDDFQFSPVGAAMHVQIEAQMADDQTISHWRQTIWSCPHAQRPGSGGNINMLAATERDSIDTTKTVNDLPDKIGGGASRNAKPPYSIKSFGATTHIVQDLPVTTSSIRGLGAQMNIVCIEAAMDQLANESGTDPIDFRLKHLDDRRECAVLHQLKAQLDAASLSLSETEAIGIGYSRYKGKAAYAAVAVLIRLTDKVELVEVWAVVDAGLIVDRSGAVNQIEGGIIQAASWTLCEGAILRDGYIDAAGWDDYPILGWPDIPSIHTTLINEQSELPYLGIGECMVGPVSAAIVNAVSQLAGCSMSDLPLTREKFLQAASSE